jgi:hypothetical protein
MCFQRRKAEPTIQVHQKKARYRLDIDVPKFRKCIVSRSAGFGILGIDELDLLRL